MSQSLDPQLSETAAGRAGFFGFVVVVLLLLGCAAVVVVLQGTV